MDDFIQTYDDVLDPSFCEALIAQFERSPHRRRGEIGHGVDTDAKESLDVNISMHEEWAAVHQQVVELTFHRLVTYMRTYPHMLTGALMLKFPHPETGQPAPIDATLLERLADRTVESVVRHLYRLGTINLQKYACGKGGYHHWHSENYPRANDPQCEALHRTLLFMYYLNDVEEGGETEFFYQRRILRPCRGQLVVAPSGFTHTHRGNVPRSGDKYILTSWVMFRTAAQLFGS